MRISDWSSDVCSSDLYESAGGKPVVFRTLDIGGDKALPYLQSGAEENPAMGRSEERRVGKECVSTCRSRWSPYHYKQHNNPKYSTTMVNHDTISSTNNKKTRQQSLTTTKQHHA